MKRITSIKNAIKYFVEGTKIETRTTSDGAEYQVFIPPTSFRRMRVSFPFQLGTITHIYESFQWKDYATMLERDRKDISKLVLYIED